MKPSHFKTPRNFAETTFETGYKEAHFHAEQQEPLPEIVVRYTMAIAAGFIIAVLIFT